MKTITHEYDDAGREISITDGVTGYHYQYDLADRVTHEDNSGSEGMPQVQLTSYYDFEGNRKTQTRLSDGQLTEYFWDHRNQLTKALVKDANGVLLKELRFSYDVQGRRVGMWVDADGAGPGDPDQVWTVYDGANPYMDFDGEGQVQTRYLTGPGVDELFARIGAGEDPEWYLTDRLGSVRQIVDASGHTLDDLVYDSFGGMVSESNPAEGDRFKFTGREYSSELDIYYYRARWYDPATGQFISPAPIGFQAGDANLYRYVGNGPLDATDPTGFKVFWCVRDLDTIFPGNHHFIMVIPDNPKDFSDLMDLFGEKQGISLAGFESKKDKWLICEKNQKADIAAFREFCDPKKYARRPEKYKSGWSVECNEVPSPKGMTDTEFIKILLKGAKNYEENSWTECFKFGLFFGPNCASWANSLFNYAGVNEADRLRLGEFGGTDWGEELLIGDGMWDQPKRN